MLLHVLFGAKLHLHKWYAIAHSFLMQLHVFFYSVCISCKNGCFCILFFGLYKCLLFESNILRTVSNIDAFRKMLYSIAIIANIFIVVIILMKLLHLY